VLTAKLLRPIYGLKQSGRSWNEELNSFLIDLGCKRMKSSSCVYMWKDSTIILIYVDDIFFFGPDNVVITNIVNKVIEKYEAKDLGEIKFALGVKIEENKGIISLSQEAYINSMLRRFNMFECRKAETPLDPGVKLHKGDSQAAINDKQNVSQVQYREVVGSLMYLALHTRPDILYAVTKLSQYNSRPGEEHWHQAKHILRYINKTKDYRMTYRAGTEEKIRIYCDADWGADLDDRHSFSGLVVKIGENIVKWRCTKQKCITTSTMEAEYVSLSSGVKEAMWIKMFLNETKLINSVTGDIELYCDNRAAIDFSKGWVEKSRTKHIDISYHLVREKMEEGWLQLHYVPSNENPADIMTKGLKRVAHSKCVESLGMGVTKWGNCGE